MYKLCKGRLTSWKLDIVTPGRPFKPLNDTSFDSCVFKKSYPRALTVTLLLAMVQVNSGLWIKYVANEANLRIVSECHSVSIRLAESWAHPFSSVIVRVALVSRSGVPSFAKAQMGGNAIVAI